MFEFPFADLGLIAAEEDVGHLPTFVVSWTGVDGGGENIVLKTVGESRLLIADDAWYHADNGIGNHRCHEFTTRQYEITDGDLASDEMVADTLVNPFIMTCEDDEVALQREFVSDMLVEAFTIG